MTPGDARRLDVVLFGASGFTGRLVAEYLAEHAPTLRWALAGRSREKLERVKSELVAVHPALSALEVLVADAGDRAALAAVARRTRVVCTTVGPYGRHGRELASVCAGEGTDCCDLTGEVPFVRDSIDRNHARAEATGARIVHACGFDSIPSDLGVMLLADHFASRGRTLASALLVVGPMRGGPSGGTIASGLLLLEEAQASADMRRLLADPYALLPDRSRDRGPDRGEQTGVRFEPRLGEWTGPFVMGAFNARIVRRTNALTGFRYGKQFRYDEAMTFGRGPRGMLRAAAFAAGLGATLAAGMTGLGRSVLARLLPSPGEGPSKEQREAGFFRIRILGESDAAAGAPLSATARVAGTRDPGYGETAKMLGESALCLALDRDRLEPRSGVLTPAAAMGPRLVERLRAAGMTFRVEEGAPGGS